MRMEINCASVSQEEIDRRLRINMMEELREEVEELKEALEAKTNLLERVNIAWEKGQSYEDFWTQEFNNDLSEEEEV